MANPLTYPDLLYKLHPHVLKVHSLWKNAKAPITGDTQEAMIDHVIALALQADPSLREHMPNMPSTEMQIAQRGGLFRDLVGIILIDELLGRRRPLPPRPPIVY